MSEPAHKNDQKPIVIIKKKKGRHGGGHHGGAWKVAYADFVTAMMAFFLVMWLLTQADLKLRSQIARYFRDPGILDGGSLISQDGNVSKSRDPATVAKDIVVVPGKEDSENLKRGVLNPPVDILPSESEAAHAEQERLEAEAKAIRAAVVSTATDDPDFAQLRSQVIVQVTDAGLSIQVVDKGREMLFDLSSAALKPPLVALLKRIAVVLSRLPNDIQIGGHTDARPYPADSPITNWDLSFERANAARKILETNGLRPGQVTRILAFASSQPIVPENPMADENRRLSILAERKRPPNAEDRDTTPLPR